MSGFDLLLLAFKGIAIASLPIAAIWVGRARRDHGDPLQRLAWVTAFLTFDLIVFGGFTRLTDSGLGCPDWPGCYAKANPLMAAHDIRAAEAVMPFGPVSMSKAWIEMIHRYLAMAVGVLIVAMLAISVMRVWKKRRGSGQPATATDPAAYPSLAFGLLALVGLQGAFGAWTVTQKLQPIFVTMHLMLGLALLGLLIFHALKLNALPMASRQATGRATPRLAGTRAWAGVAAGVLAIQIALGGWVSANYAVLACSDFPTCHGVWLPAMDFSSGFDPWRDLGRSADGGYLSIAALTAIHWLHRSFAAIAFLVVGGLAVRVRSIEGLARPALWLGSLLVSQLLTGLVNVVFAWPLVAAVLHNAGAAALVATLVVINYRLARLASSGGLGRSTGSPSIAARAGPQPPIRAAG